MTFFEIHRLGKALLMVHLILLGACQSRPLESEAERLIGPIPEASRLIFQTRSAWSRIDEYLVPPLESLFHDTIIRLEHILDPADLALEAQLIDYETKRAEDCQLPQYDRVWSGLEVKRPATVVMLTCPRTKTGEAGYLRLTKAIVSQGTYIVAIELKLPPFEVADQLKHQDEVAFWVGQIKAFKVCGAPKQALACP